VRVAFSLPNLPPTAIERAQVEATVAALAERVEVEIFTEAQRLREGELPAPAFHYLRMPERHAAAPFDAALHAVGRDFRPYEAAVLLARKLPSIVWFLDTMTHHVLVGGLAPFGRWDRYGAIQREHSPAGAMVTSTIAAGWGTRAVFRTRDPLPAMLGRDNQLLAASTDVAAGIGGDVPIVPLPTDIAALRRQARPRTAVRTIAVIAPNLSWPGPELRALKAVLDVRPELKVRYHLIKWFEGAVLGPAAALGVRDQIEWVIEDGIETRMAVADSGDAVVATTGDPTLNDRGLVMRAMAGGQVAVVMRAPAWESLPTGTLVVVEPGREREAGLRQTLLALAADGDLAAGIGRAAAHQAGEISAPHTAGLLHDALTAASAQGAPVMRRTADLALRHSRGLMIDYTTPQNAGAATRALVASGIDAILPDAEGSPVWRQP
jgi:hypothetical protein